MKKLLIALCLTCTAFAHSGYIPDSLDEEASKLWYGSKDDQVLMCLAKIYICHKAGKIDHADFYMDLLEAIIHDEPLPD